jgi:anti-sigma B factor antagonist
VTAENAILAESFDGFTWIRCEGKGSFLTSPALKSFAEARVAAGERCIVVDLAACTGMDSTFMGTLAGLAARLSAPGGKVQVADVNERNRRSLEDLGLDFLLEIDPPVALWRGRVDEVRASLRHVRDHSAPGQLERAKHVLEAHQVLSAANPENAQKFAGVVHLLESEVAEKEDSEKR